MADHVINDLDNILQEFLGPVVVEQANRGGPILSQIDKQLKDVEVEGRDLVAKISLWTKHNERGVRVGSESGALPRGQAATFVLTSIPMCYQYGAVSFTGQALAASRGKRALMKFATKLTKDVVDTVQLDIDRMFHGDGTGWLGRINGSPVATDTTLTVDAIPGTIWMRDNMGIDIYSAKASGTLRTGGDSLVISSVDDNTTITLTEELASGELIVDNDYVIKEDTTEIEMMGLLGIVDDGASYVDAYQSITRTTAGNTYWKAIIVDNNDVAFDVDVIQQACDKVFKATGKWPTTGLQTHEIARKWKGLHTDERMFPAKPITIKDGWRGLEYEPGTGKPIQFFPSRFCYPGTIFLLHLPSIFIVQATNGWEWMRDGTSKGVLKQRRGASAEYDIFDATGKMYQNFACDQPRTCARIDSVPES